MSRHISRETFLEVADKYLNSIINTNELSSVEYLFDIGMKANEHTEGLPFKFLNENFKKFKKLTFDMHQFDFKRVMKPEKRRMELAKLAAPVDNPVDNPVDKHDSNNEEQE